MYKNNYIRKSTFALALCALGFASTARAEEPDSLSADAASQVVAAFEKNNIFNIIDDFSKKSKGLVVSDDICANLSNDVFASMVGEDFEIDEEKGMEIPEFWDQEFGKSSDWEYQIMYGDEQAILRNTAKTFTQGREFTAEKSQVFENARMDLATLGVEYDERNFQIEIEYLMSMTLNDKDKTSTVERIAYRVFVYRKVGGLIVRGARILLGYYMDGTLQKVSMRWPRIVKQQLEFESLSEMDKQKLIEKAASILPTMPSMTDNLKGVIAEVGLEIRDGVLKRVVVFRPAETPDSVGPLEEVVIDL